MQRNLLWILWLVSILVTWSLSRRFYYEYPETSISVLKGGCDKTATENGQPISFREPSWMKSNPKPSLLAAQINTITDYISEVDDKAVLNEQVQIQEVFQRIIYELQHPKVCHEARRHSHTGNHPLDGFALEFQNLARHLQTAIASHRTFEIPYTWKSAYAPPSCKWSTGVNVSASDDVIGDFLCLWQPPSHCAKSDMKIPSVEPPERVENPLPNGAGIVTDSSRWFDTHHYGPKRSVGGGGGGGDRKWFREQHPDIIPFWDRTMGRFWVRAQMAHYLWRPSSGLQSEIDKRLPTDLLNGKRKFIGMHIRKTDNTMHLLSDFGRDADITRSVSRFMQIAEYIRKENPEIDTIYLATDNSEVVKEAMQSTGGRWKLVVQRNVARSNSKELMWFRDSRAFGAASIATDIEMLRRADFLIGSHQSNVYRLATELNTAWNVAKYPLRLNRLRTVDIPWYEHP